MILDKLKEIQEAKSLRKGFYNYSVSSADKDVTKKIKDNITIENAIHFSILNCSDKILKEAERLIIEALKEQRGKKTMEIDEIDRVLDENISDDKESSGTAEAKIHCRFCGSNVEANSVTIVKSPHKAYPKCPDCGHCMSCAWLKMCSRRDRVLKVDEVLNKRSESK